AAQKDMVMGYAEGGVQRLNHPGSRCSGNAIAMVKGCFSRYSTGVWFSTAVFMGHVYKNKEKLLNRLKRLRGQIEAIQRSVDADDECARVLQQATACRGALDGFIAEMIQDHIREHVVDASLGHHTPQAVAAEELIEIVHQYLKRKRAAPPPTLVH